MVTHPASDSTVSPASASAEASQLNWRTCWYPIAFAVDLPADRPYGCSIYSEPLVLFRATEGSLVCLQDRCPHRLAKLSDGQVNQGRLECLYHGWQFGQGGTCLHIPHLPADATLPDRARVRSFPVVESQGIVWVWADAEAPPTPPQPPAVDEIEQPGVFRVDTATDFPFDHVFLVENLLDPAHVYISHDRTELGIRREDAAPLAIEILATDLTGIQGRFRRADRPQAPWTSLTFQAPMLVHYSFSNPAHGLIGGLALYALPVAYGQSRLLVRRYGNRFKSSFTRKPRWLEHLRQSKILEEDLRFIVEQDRFFRQGNQPLQTAYFPLKTCDALVIEHRRWLDRYGQHLPWFVGYTTSKRPDPPLVEDHPLPTERLASRWQRHTQHCQACGGAYRRLGQVQRWGQGVGIAALGLALVSHGGLQGLGAIGVVGSAIAITLAGRLKTRFETTFDRHGNPGDPI